METSSPSAASNRSQPAAADIPRKRVFRLPERALIVDEQPGARQALRDVVVEMGVRQVDTARDPQQALELIEAEPYPLVLSEVNFKGPFSGSQLLEVVRTRRLMPAHSAFVLVVSEASRSLVATTSEWQPDALLLKPIVHAVVAPRIEQAIRRRTAYAKVHEASLRDDPAELLAAVDALIQRLGAPSIELLRWRTQALLALGKFEDAQACAALALGERRPLPWAQVALAQVAHAQGRSDEARAMLEAQIAADPYQGAAYDLLIKVHQATGQTEEALAVARAAVKPLSTPRRLRTLGEMAYAQDELELAETCYTTLISKTAATPVRSALDIGMLGQVLVTQGEAGKALELVNRSRAQRVGAAKGVEGVEGANGFEVPQGAEEVAAQALAESVAAQAHSLRGDHDSARTHARRAIELATSAAAVASDSTTASLSSSRSPSLSPSVTLLIAQGAQSAGLGEEAMALVRQVLGDDPLALAHTQPMAARVLRRAGFAVPKQVISEPAAPAPKALDDGPHHYMQPGATDPAEPSDTPEPAAGFGAIDTPEPAATPGAIDTLEPAVRPGSTEIPALPMRPPPPGPLQVSQRLMLSDDALYQGHHAEAIQHAQSALAKAPDHPMALLALLRSQLMRMQTEGYDRESAAIVHDCLRALERLTPGASGRLFKALLAQRDGPEPG